MVSTSFSMRVGTSGRSRPGRVATALLGFALASLVFLLVPSLIRDDVGVVHGFTGQEAMDLLTPLVTMPLLVLAFELTGRMGTRARLLLVVLVSVWVAGQAIHLATNAIGDLFQAGSARDAFYATDVGNLDHYLDETLSHWLWHGAWAGLLVVLLWTGISGPAGGWRRVRSAVVVSGVAGLVHGFTWFVVTDEGGTWALGIPVTAVLLLAAWLTRRRDPDRVVTTFLILGSLASLVLYAIWIAVYGWPPGSICETLKIC